MSAKPTPTMAALDRPALSAAATAFLGGPHRPFIAGRFTDATGEAAFTVENPSREQTIAHVQASGPEDIRQAVAAARNAFQTGWGAMAPRDRARILLQFADLLQTRAALIGEVESIESGIPIGLSVPTIAGFCVDLIRYYAGWATKIEGQTIPAVANGREDQDLLVYTLREPAGVVAAIVPWNAPIGMIVLKLAPALAAGCTVVLKTAELAPLSAELLIQAWQDAGGPPGSVNVLHGFGHTTGAALVSHPGIDKIAFTGSTAVGKQIVHAAANDLRRVSLELGGKSPVIIFPDAPLPEAIPAAALACFFLSGQNCMAGTRLFVHRSIHDAVVDGLAQFSQVLTLGDSLSPATMIGPVISATHRGRINGHIKTAVDEGGRIAYAAPVPAGPGYFVPPTIITGVSPSMRIARDEVFGPVLGVQVFGDDEDELAAAVNATAYGLSGSIWTQDLRRAHRFARRIDSGQVGVNIHAAISPETPFGGNRQSGWGREFGREGLDAYLKTKAISVNLGPRR